MKAMKAKKGITATAAYSTVAEKTGLKPSEVKEAVQGLVEVAAEELKKNGAFNFGGALKLKLKVKPARKATKGVNPFTKEPCVFKARPASKTVKAFALTALKDLIN